ncbi:hypothetical protein ACJMK2_019303 [Sinanodonta woodiana]|uniref:C3H1-type domain-containing protein n=1 Tax=Sinanodonta woodiana TaxID=1069815 RepID=A0ABD3UI31_SINWO
MSQRSRRKRGDVYSRNYDGHNDHEYWISSVLRCLIRNKNRMELKKLQKKIEDQDREKHPNFERQIKRYPNLFRLEKDDLATEDEGVLENTIVSGTTELRLCEKHCSTAGSCKSQECKSLHMCRFYILNECDYKPCLFGHEIRNDHNVEILRKHVLHALGPRDLGDLLRDVRNRNETTMPTTCTFYNIKKGCQREDCQFLHLCKKFVEENCKFGSDCKRSHNCFDIQPVKVFKRYGIHEKDVTHVMRLIRSKAATGMKQACNITPKIVKNPLSQGPSNRYFVHEKDSTSASCKDAPERPKQEAIYTRSHRQNDNTFRNVDELGPDTFNIKDSRHVVIDPGYQNKPKYCHGDFVPPDIKSQVSQTHQTHMKEGTHFEDISEDEDDDPPDNAVVTNFLMQERVRLGTSIVSSPKETQNNQCDEEKSVDIVQTFDNQNTNKPFCAKSPLAYGESMELKNDTMDCPGIASKLPSYPLVFLENKGNQTQIKSKPTKRVFIPPTDISEEEKIVPAEIPNYISDLSETEGTLAANEMSKYDTENKRFGNTFKKPTDEPVFKKPKCNNLELVPALAREYSQVAIDKSSENNEKVDATNIILNDDIHNSDESNMKESAEVDAFNSSQETQDMLPEDSVYKPKSVSDDRSENVNKIDSSTVSTEDRKSEWPVGTQEFKVKRVSVNNKKSQWMFCSVDTCTSLNMDSETQEKLEKSYQVFQQSRQCFLEASGSRLHVDFMTMNGKVLNNHIKQQGQ